MHIAADTLQVMIMRKETLIIQAKSPAARDNLVSEFKECIEFAGSCEQHLSDFHCLVLTVLSSATTIQGCASTIATTPWDAKITICASPFS